MPSKYKVIYFNGRGRAEAIRYLLSYLGVAFEDERVTFEDWPKLRPNTPYGQLPILEIDGKQYTQSISILRYLGKKGKLSGTTEQEDLNIDIIADILTDLFSAVVQAIHEPNEETKKTKKEKVVAETLPFYLKKLEENAKNNGGYSANKKLSWVDFMFAAITENISSSFPEIDVFEGYPTLLTVKNRVISFPKVKAYIEKRPTTPF